MCDLRPRRIGAGARLGFARVAAALWVSTLPTLSCRAVVPEIPPVPPLVREPSGVVERVPFAEPELRVGVRVGVDSVIVSSPGGLRAVDREGRRAVLESGPGQVWRFRGEGGRLEARPAAGEEERAAGEWGVLRIEPLETGAPLFVDGRPYRGTVELLAVPGRGLNAINRVTMEAYLRGVVPIEIGPRPPEEFAAVAAQAVAARTYALANLNAHAEMGFDLFATVADQVYDGILAERDDATRAVRETEGWVLTWEGSPIRAYYHSTCGGRTAAVREVLDRPDAPYLRPVLDRDAAGRDYCAISPRYRWTAEFDREAMDGRVRDGLAAHFGVVRGEVGRLERLEVRGRTPSGRVQEVTIAGTGSEYRLSRNDIRFVLRSRDGAILNSTHFEVEPLAGGGARLRGRGYGHGVGMCQFGAIGRARAGQPWQEILRTYYPGAQLTRVYGGEEGAEG